MKAYVNVLIIFLIYTNVHSQEKNTMNMENLPAVVIKY
jgi:hypothetical protein